MSINDQAEHTRKFVHIAPEIISGESRQSIYSDIYSVGGVLYKIMDSKKIDSDVHIRYTIEGLAGKCRLVQYHKRPKAKAALTCLQDLLVTF